MKIRFQADADLNPIIGRILVAREPLIDWRPARRILPDGLPDPEVLRVAAVDDRVLVTCDARTMRGHFEKFIVNRASPGVLQTPREMRTADVVAALLRVWRDRDAEELRNQIWWLPRP